MQIARALYQPCNAMITAIVSVSMGVNALPIRAQTALQWQFPADGNWTDPTQWIGGTAFPNNGQPDPADTYDAVIDATGSPYTVTLDSDIAINGLTVDSPDALIEHNAGALTVSGVFDLESGTYRLNGGRLAESSIAGGASGQIDLASRSFFNSVSVSANINGAGGMVIEGFGAVLNNTNTFLGLVEVNSGNLYVTNNQALGAGGSDANGTVVNPAGSLSLATGVKLDSEKILLNGGRIGGGTFGGTIDLQANSTLTAGVYDGAITGDGGLNLSGPNIALNGPNTDLPPENQPKICEINSRSWTHSGKVRRWLGSDTHQNRSSANFGRSRCISTRG